MPRDFPDRSDREGPNLTRAFRDVVGHREDLFRLLVQQQVVIPKMPATHMPVKILCLQIQDEYVSKQMTQAIRYFAYALLANIGGGFRFTLYQYFQWSRIILGH